jgi:hypothetical protein
LEGYFEVLFDFGGHHVSTPDLLQVLSSLVISRGFISPIAGLPGVFLAFHVIIPFAGDNVAVWAKLFDGRGGASNKKQKRANQISTRYFHYFPFESFHFSRIQESIKQAPLMIFGPSANSFQTRIFRYYDDGFAFSSRP